MTLYTENTHELVKVYYESDYMSLSPQEFAKVFSKFHQGTYELIIIEEE